MNRNERIKQQARIIRDTVNASFRSAVANVNGFEYRVNFSLLGPTERAEIAEAVHKIICEASGVKP